MVHPRGLHQTKNPCSPFRNSSSRHGTSMHFIQFSKFSKSGGGLCGRAVLCPKRGQQLGLRLRFEQSRSLSEWLPELRSARHGGTRPDSRDRRTPSDVVVGQGGEPRIDPSSPWREDPEPSEAMACVRRAQVSDRARGLASAPSRTRTRRRSRANSASRGA